MCNQCLPYSLNDKYMSDESAEPTERYAAKV